MLHKLVHLVLPSTGLTLLSSSTNFLPVLATSIGSTGLWEKTAWFLRAVQNNRNQWSFHDSAMTATIGVCP